MMTLVLQAGAVLALGSLAAGIALTQSGSDSGLMMEDIMPACEQAEFDGSHQDCFVSLSNGRVIVRMSGLSEDEWGDPVETVDLTFRRDDGLVQSFADRLGSSFLHPGGSDIDGDGDDDLLLPQATGNVNTTWRVWVQGERGFTEAGEVNGIEVAPQGEGLVAVPARSSAAEWETAYYRVEDGRLHGVFSVATDLSAGSCSVTDWGGLENLGLTVEQAAARYCETQ